MKKILAAFVTAFWSVAAFAGSTITTDFTDLWWVPSESGWGANVIQQNDTLFITMFVYDQNNRASWFVGSAIVYQGTFGGAQKFSGSLYQTTGPYYGAASFNPGNVTVREVGTITFSAPTANTATITYTADSVTVTKNVQRQTWRNESVAGAYIGASIGTFSGCSTNGITEVPANYTIQQTASQVIINEFGPDYTCGYTGTYTQSGKMGTIVGTGTCTGGGQQGFTASEVQVGTDFISMKFDSSLGTCRFLGRIGGMRRQ